MSKLSRRQVLRGASLASCLAVLTACGATPTPQVIKEVVTQVVEKEVTKIVEGTPQVVKETVVVEVEKEVVVTATPEAAAPPPLPVEKELTLSWWTFPIGLPAEEWPHGKWEGELCQRYTAEVKPNVKVELQPLGWEAYDKLVTAISAGTPPHLLGRGCNAYTVMARKSGIQVEVELEEDLKNDLPEGWLEGMQWQGKTYYVPWYVGAQGPLLNMSIVKEAKAEDLLPKPPCRSWNLDEWLELLKACTFTREDGTSVYGTSLFTTASTNLYAWGFMVLLWNAGSDYIVFDQAQNKWVSPLAEEAGVAWLKRMQDLFFVHNVVPDPRGVDDAKSSGYWTGNQGAFHLPGPSISEARATGVTIDPETLVVTDPAGFEWIFVQNPVVPGGKHTTWGGPDLDVNLQPFNTGDVGAIAPTIEFAHWVANRENEEWLGQYTIPVRKSAVAKYEDDPLLQWMFGCWVPNSRTEFNTNCTVQECDIWMEMWQTLFLPTDPQQVADEWVNKLSALDCWEV